MKRGIAQTNKFKEEERAEGVLLSAVNIRKAFTSPAGNLEILRGVDLTIQSSEICFIVGRSGAGKSTLLHILASLDKPTEGSVFFRGVDLASLNESRLACYRNQRMGFIFQFYYLLPELNLIENVMLPSLIKKKKDRKKALALLEKMGLENRAYHFPSQLSGGEQQRTAIARALINGPDIVFCDEPTGNLDEETADQVFQLILDLNRNDGQTFCIVTHEESLIREGYLVYNLHEGRLTLNG